MGNELASIQEVILDPESTRVLKINIGYISHIQNERPASTFWVSLIASEHCNYLDEKLSH